jgi:hypothetical protein
MLLWCVLLLALGISFSTAESSSSSSFSSSILPSVVGGATQAAQSTETPSAFLGSNAQVEDDELIYIQKRDGRPEGLDGTKVSTLFELDVTIYIYSCYIYIYIYIDEALSFVDGMRYSRELLQFVLLYRFSND